MWQALQLPLADLQDRIQAGRHRLAKIANPLAAAAPEVTTEAVHAALAAFDGTWTNSRAWASSTMVASSNSANRHEEDLTKMVARVSSGPRILNDVKGLEVLGKSSGIVDLVGISGHLESVTPLHIAGHRHSQSHVRAAISLLCLTERGLPCLADLLVVVEDPDTVAKIELFEDGKVVEV